MRWGKADRTDAGNQLAGMRGVNYRAASIPCIDADAHSSDDVERGNVRRMSQTVMRRRRRRGLMLPSAT